MFTLLILKKKIRRGNHSEQITPTVFTDVYHQHCVRSLVNHMATEEEDALDVKDCKCKARRRCEFSVYSSIMSVSEAVNFSIWIKKTKKANIIKAVYKRKKKRTSTKKTPTRRAHPWHNRSKLNKNTKKKQHKTINTPSAYCVFVSLLFYVYGQIDCFHNNKAVTMVLRLPPVLSEYEWVKREQGPIIRKVFQSSYSLLVLHHHLV